MNNSLAIDIVLLPPPNISDEMVALSNHLNDTYGEKIRLNLKDRLPHISLLMGVVDRKNIENIEKVLKKLAAELLPIELTMTGLKSRGSSSAIELKETPELEALQKALAKETQDWITSNATAEMFYDTPTEKNVEWVKNYLGHTHIPHITVGPVFENESYDNLRTFSADTLAACHLGRHCTCREVLTSNKLH